MEFTRRRFLAGSSALALASVLGKPISGSAQIAPDYPLRKIIPSTGEILPVIGMGTWITFNVGDNLRLRNERLEVLRTFFELGGGMIDSSPMYGSAEEVVGYCLSKLKKTDSLFSATKIWTSDPEEGPKQFEDSKRLWGVPTIDLEQVHNLVSWKRHLAYLRELKQSGQIRYLGVTTSHGRRHRDLEKIMESEPLDFVQLTYNIDNRAVESRLLPLAKEKKIFVIANRPFGGGRLIRAIKRHPLPEWAKEIHAPNWASFLLKFVISHEAIGCAIPATSKVKHMRENMLGGRGTIPNADMRKKMLEYISTL